MSDHPLTLRTADASPVLDFVRSQTRPSPRLSLILLTVLVAGGLAWQGGRVWTSSKIAAAMPEKSMKILAVVEKNSDVPALAEENDRAQLAAGEQAFAERQDKPAVAAALRAHDKTRTDLGARPARPRPVPHPPSRVMVASGEKPVDHAGAEALPASAGRPEPQQAIVMPEVTLKSHVRLTGETLN
ncbi:hypothetical protein BCF11_1144 [Collimonas sp. PA-H2]|uniref:hypothetical protein n=1 Tax=Collimonas sp. PA-H2 TaxID=1881062 RepID=UPI000BF87057|nr:hypothetical protein [Collimonas sp. PA-H2]PFH08770.1 hypothetical protein BCF11_1144 [Collimonas sp. PA-H2]